MFQRSACSASYILHYKTVYEWDKFADILKVCYYCTELSAVSVQIIFAVLVTSLKSPLDGQTESEKAQVYIASYTHPKTRFINMKEKFSNCTAQHNTTAFTTSTLHVAQSKFSLETLQPRKFFALGGTSFRDHNTHKVSTMTLVRMHTGG